MGTAAAVHTACPGSAEVTADGAPGRWSGPVDPSRRPNLAGVLTILGLISFAEPARALESDPLVPLLHRVETFLQSRESAGVTMDPRFDLNPPEIARLSIVAQLLGYADLYVTTRDPAYLDRVATRADFLVARIDDVTSGTVFDGMLGYALLTAYEHSGDERYFTPGGLIAERLKATGEGYTLLNWGMMAAMCLAKYQELTGDTVALQRTRSIVAQLRTFENEDGSFPHYCPGTRDVHYTGWLGMELAVVRRCVPDPAIDGMLERITRFLAARLDSAGRPGYTDCPGSCLGDSDGDRVCEELDRCGFTPRGCASDSSGCEVDVDGDGTCDQGCWFDEDGDGVCDAYDLCPGTAAGCWADRLGCEADLDHDGRCDPVSGLRPCSQLYSIASGCVIDYDTRGWANELGYEALLLDRFGDPRYHAVMAFLYALSDHGAVPDKWDYLPQPEDEVYPWANDASSVMRTSVVFWSLAEIYRDRVAGLRAHHKVERKPAAPAHDDRLEGVAALAGRFGGDRPTRAAAAGLDRVAMRAADAPPAGLVAVDRLAVAGVSPWQTAVSRPNPGPNGEPYLDRRWDASAVDRRPAVASPASPWSERATMRYSVAAEAEVTAAIFDLAGRRVAAWNLGRTSRGSHELVWSCRDGNGRRVPPGLYLVRLEAGARPIATGRWIVPR